MVNCFWSLVLTELWLVVRPWYDRWIGKGKEGGHSSEREQFLCSPIFILPHFCCCCVFFIFQEPFQVKVASEALLIMDLVRIIYCVYLVILIYILVYFYCRHKREYGRPVFWILTILFYKESKNKSFLLEKSQTIACFHILEKIN